MRIGAKDYSWSFIGTFLNTAVNLVLLPFVIHYLGPDELGLWYVFASINTLVLLLDFGFTPTIARNIAYCWSGAKSLLNKDISNEVGGSVDPRLFCEVLRASRFIFLALSLIGLVLMFVFGTAFLNQITSEDAVPLWKYAWFVYALAIFLNLFFAYISAYLRGVGAVAENAKAISASKVFQLILTVGLLIAGFGILGTAIGFFISCFVQRVLGLFYFKRYENVASLLDVGKQRNSFGSSFSIIKTIWHNAWRDGLVALAMYLSTQANTLICSSVLGLSSTGTYGLALQVSTAIASVSSIWYTTSQPKLQEYALKKDSRRASKLFSSAMAVYCLISFIAYGAFLLIGPPVIILLNSGFDLDIGMLFAICLYMFLYRANVLFVSCISNYNTIPYSRAYVLTGIVSVAVSYLAALYSGVGLWSIILPPIVFLLVYNGWKWPSAAFVYLGVSPRLFLKEGVRELKNLFRKLIRKKQR